MTYSDDDMLMLSGIQHYHDVKSPLLRGRGLKRWCEYSWQAYAARLNIPNRNATFSVWFFQKKIFFAFFAYIVTHVAGNGDCNRI